MKNNKQLILFSEKGNFSDMRVFVNEGELLIEEEISKALQERGESEYSANKKAERIVDNNYYRIIDNYNKDLTNMKINGKNIRESIYINRDVLRANVIKKLEELLSLVKDNQADKIKLDWRLAGDYDEEDEPLRSFYVFDGNTPGQGLLEELFDLSNVQQEINEKKIEDNKISQQELATKMDCVKRVEHPDLGEVIRIGGDELDEYYLNVLVRGVPTGKSITKVIYRYKEDFYSGSGVIVYLDSDGQWHIDSLGHCSCFGPIEQYNGIGYSLEQVVKLLEEKDERYAYEANPIMREIIIELVKEQGE